MKDNILMNFEHPCHKTGLLGELFVKIRLNDLGINTGGVDRDTGTDLVLFFNKKILTGQIKSGYNAWNDNNDIHGVDIHFKVKIVDEGYGIQLDKCEIKWKFIDLTSNFTSLNESFLMNFVDKQ